MVQDISAARARAVSGVKPVGAQAGDPVVLEQEEAARARQEQTARLRKARLAKEAEIREARRLAGLSQVDLAEPAGVEFVRDDGGIGVRRVQAGP